MGGAWTAGGARRDDRYFHEGEVETLTSVVQGAGSPYRFQVGALRRLHQAWGGVY